MKTLLSLILILLISNCAYNPIIDSKGRSGTWNESRAVEMTDDIQHCKLLAEQHLSALDEAGSFFNNHIFRPFYLWLPPEEKRTRENYVRNCLRGRGHNVIN